MSHDHSDRNPAYGVVVVIALMAGLAGWWLGQQRADASNAPAATKPVTATPAPPSLHRPQPPKVHRAVAADVATSGPAPANFSDLVARYSPAQQAVIKGFYGQYAKRMMQFSTPAQLAWLRRTGFPMPEDVLAAQFLSDDQLRQRADAGDVKAAAFLFDRLAHESGYDVDKYGDHVPEMGQLMRTVVGSGSPFGGYFYVRYNTFTARFVRGADAAAMARRLADEKAVGAYWASLFGDRRLADPAAAAIIPGHVDPALNQCVRRSDPEYYLPLLKFVILMKSALAGSSSQLFPARRDLSPLADDPAN